MTTTWAEKWRSDLADWRYGQMVMDRLLSNIALDGTCWSWERCVAPDGYGMISVKRSMVKVHLVAYFLFRGPVPSPLQLDHVCHTEDASCPGGPSCRHRSCVNPWHLEPVSPRENALRARPSLANAARWTAMRERTHCRHGHRFDDKNTYIDPSNGTRKCRRCRADGMRRSARRSA